MSDRKGVLLIMYDLPMLTGEDRKEYYHFTKKLRLQGFVQLQESCYLKLIRNTSSRNDQINQLKFIMPKHGNVSVLPMNLSTFQEMQCMAGEPFNMELFTGDTVFIGGEDEETA